jgi:hypothetical protein
MKLAGQNQRGQPDRLFILGGRVLFVEFKASGKIPTALQLRWLLNLHHQGMTVGWCNDIAKGKNLIDKAFP